MRFSHVVSTFVALAAAIAFAACSDDGRPAATPSPTEPGKTTVVEATPLPTATPTVTPAAASPTTAIDERLKLRLITVATGDNRALNVEFGQGSGGAWSPDSARLAVPGDSPSIVDVATGARTALWNTRCAAAAWSPGGAQVAAVCADGFVVVDSGGKLPQQDMTIPTDWVKRTPWVRWSPDGKSVVYGASNTVMRTMRLDGTRNSIRGAFFDAQWLTDGRLVTLELPIEKDPATTIRLRDAARIYAVVAEAVTRAGAQRVTIDPQHGYAAYGVYGPAASGGVPRILPSTVYVLNIATGEEVASFGAAYGPAEFSRDGRSLVMQQDYCGSNWALLVGRLDGQTRRIPIGGAFVMKFSPDGSQIALTKGTELWVVASDGSSAARRVATEVHGPAGFEWSPDSKMISVPPFFGGYDQCP